MDFIDQQMTSDSKDAVPDAAPMTNLQKHDIKYHPNGYKEGDSCKYRELLKKGDVSDILNPEDVKGEEIEDDSQKGEDTHSKVKKAVKKYLSSSKSEKWLMKSLGIESHTDKILADHALTGFALGQLDKHKLVSALEKLVASNTNKVSNNHKAYQMDIPSLGTPIWDGLFSKYYHSQGTRTVSNDIHKPTGLYKTMRPGGKALAREEDVDGMNPFNKNRARFIEHGSMPAALTDAELENFRYTSNGSTYPMVGNVDGRNYIVKRGILPHGVRKNDDLQEHIRYEVAADKFIRAAGLNAPECVTFERKIPPRKSNIKIDETKIQTYFDKIMAYKRAKNAEERIFADDNQTLGTWRRAKAESERAETDAKSFAKSLGKDNDEYKAELRDRVNGGKLYPKGQSNKTELVKIAEYVDGGVSLLRTWKEGSQATKTKIHQQVIDSYPIISFLMNTDAYKNDNILCDSDDNLWFIDNGACFDFRAQGGKKLLVHEKDGDNILASANSGGKPWYFERTDPTDYYTGYLGLIYDKGQTLLQEILSDVSDDELVAAAKKYNFTQLVETLPENIKNRGTMREYAKNLDAVIAHPPKGWLTSE